MELKDQNILFFTRSMGLGGTENVILQLCEILQPHVNKIVVCSCGGVNEEKLNIMGIAHYQIHDIERKNPKVIIKVSAQLKKIIKRESITIIHTHHRMSAFYVVMLRLYKKCLFLNTSHNTFTDKKSFTRFAYKKANIVACGEMVKINLVDLFKLKDSQVTVIHNAVKPFNDQLIECNEITDLHNKGYFVVGNVGRLSKQKGMEYYIQAIPKVIERNPNVHFMIIGDGEDLLKLKTLAKELNIEEYVTFMGYRNDIQNLMKQLDLIVLSSLWEGLPLTPIEAFSVGKTVVATAVDGTVEIVKDGVNGLLVESKNIEELAEKINYIINNPDERLEFEKNALIQYETGFSFEIFSKAYIDFYNDKLSGQTNG
jgi:glycosyltransferase involved in cell wall biosynthesis